MATKKKTAAKKPVHKTEAKKSLKHVAKHPPTKLTPVKHAPAPAAKAEAKKSATPFAAKKSPDSAPAPVATKGNSKPPLNAADLKRMLLERKSAPKTAIAFSLDEALHLLRGDVGEGEDGAGVLD